MRQRANCVTKRLESKIRFAKALNYLCCPHPTSQPPTTLSLSLPPLLPPPSPIHNLISISCKIHRPQLCQSKFNWLCYLLHSAMLFSIHKVMRTGQAQWLLQCILPSPSVNLIHLIKCCCDLAAGIGQRGQFGQPWRQPGGQPPASPAPHPAAARTFHLGGVPRPSACGAQQTHHDAARAPWWHRGLNGQAACPVASPHVAVVDVVKCWRHAALVSCGAGVCHAVLVLLCGGVWQVRCSWAVVSCCTDAMSAMHHWRLSRYISISCNASVWMSCSSAVCESHDACLAVVEDWTSPLGPWGIFRLVSPWKVCVCVHWDLLAVHLEMSASVMLFPVPRIETKRSTATSMYGWNWVCLWAWVKDGVCEMTSSLFSCWWELGDQPTSSERSALLKATREMEQQRETLWLQKQRLEERYFGFIDKDIMWFLIISRKTLTLLAAKLDLCGYCGLLQLSWSSSLCYKIAVFTI